MGRIRLPGEPEVEVSLKRSARARRLSLRVSGIDGRVTLTMPRSAREAEALSFARERAGWIRERLAEQAPALLAEVGVEIPVEGIPRRIERADVMRVSLESDALLVPAALRDVPGRVGAFLRQLARERLCDASARHAATLGRGHGRITLRDTRSRWGSCSHEGNLMYSWRLILAPAEVLDYVAAHEVAHLEQMNHSPAFWAVVAQLCPEYRDLRARLNREGAALHRFRFRQ